MKIEVDLQYIFTNKAYVDQVAQGLDAKPSVELQLLTYQQLIQTVLLQGATLTASSNAQLQWTVYRLL